MSCTKKKILEEVLPVHIIREVEKWPVLYMRHCPEVQSTLFKNKVWHEVAKALIDGWDTYSPAEKQCKILDLTKKWRNLRDTFKRQILIDKKIRDGHNIKKRKYVYFKHMSFLLPHMGDSDAETDEAESAPRVSRSRAVRAPRALAAPSAPDHVDEDHHFLMSLLPSFRRMSDDEKLSARMDILKVIKEVRRRSALDAYVCPLPHAPHEPALLVKSELLADGDEAHEWSAGDAPPSLLTPTY